MADHVVALVVMAQDYDPVAQPPLGFLNALVNLGLAQVEIVVYRFDSAAIERRRGRRSDGEFQVVGCCGARCHLGFPPKSIRQTGSLPGFPERSHRKSQGKLPVCLTLAPRLSLFQGVAARHVELLRKSTAKK